MTTHTLRLYRACAEELSERHRLVDLTGEINTLVTDGRVAAYANDARSLTAILGSPSGDRPA